VLFVEKPAPLAALAVIAGAALFGLAPAARSDAAPTTGQLQSAYDREAARAAALHDDQLKIVGLDCASADAATMSCTVGFTKEQQEPGRVFIDAALIAREKSGEWRLLKGLCRRLL